MRGQIKYQGVKHVHNIQAYNTGPGHSKAIAPTPAAKIPPKICIPPLTAALPVELVVAAEAVALELELPNPAAVVVGV
jgi:hypothetical protein